jgi:hypothetical protein
VILCLFWVGIYHNWHEDEFGFLSLVFSKFYDAIFGVYHIFFDCFKFFQSFGIFYLGKAKMLK